MLWCLLGYTFCLVALLSNRSFIVFAANHYCIDNTVISIAIPFDSEQPERLLTNIRNQDRYLAAQRCTWEIRIKDLVEPRQLLLQPRTKPMVGRLSAGVNENDCESTFTVQMEDFKRKLSNNTLRRHWQNFVVPVNSSSKKLLVTFNTGDSPPNADCPRVELTITLAKKGYCGWKMLLHRFHCYLVTDTEISMLHERGSGVTLAGFSDVTQLRELIRDNIIRNNIYPYRSPLNLSQPFRIGLFRFLQDGSDQIYYVSQFRNGSCKPFNVSGLILTTDNNKKSSLSARPQCGSLRVMHNNSTETADPRIELSFADCEMPMLSLVEFPETPPVAITDTIIEGCQQSAEVLTSLASSSSQELSPAAITGITVGTFAAVAVLVVSVVCLLRRKKRNQETDHRNKLHSGRSLLT